MRGTHDSKARDEDVIEEAVVQSQAVLRRRMIPCEPASSALDCTLKRNKAGPTAHRDGEDWVGLVRAGIRERLRDAEVLVRRRDVPRDCPALVEQVRLEGACVSATGMGEKRRVDRPRGGT